MAMNRRAADGPDATSGANLRRVVEVWQGISGIQHPYEAELLRGGRHSITIHLRPADRPDPSVVAKLRPQGELDLERLIHEVVLPELGVETPQFLGFHQGRGDEGDILFLEYVGSIKFLPFDPTHQAAAGRWIGTCHGASAQTSIPELIPRRSLDEDQAELLATRSRLVTTTGNPALGAEGSLLVSRVLDLLDRAAQRWPEWAESAVTVPQVLTHGVFVTRNVRMRGEGNRLVALPFDWDHVAVRCPAIDLAHASGRALGFAANASLSQYRSALAANGLSLDVGVVADVATIGTVIRAAACIGWLVKGLASEYTQSPLAELQIYGEALRGALRM